MKISKGEFIEYENPVNLNRMTIENKSVYGYTSCSAREGKNNLKACFSQRSCNIMGNDLVWDYKILLPNAK